MNKSTLDSKDKISILAMEYASLRNDINARMSSMFQLSAIFVAVAVLISRQPSVPHIDMIAIAMVVGLIIGIFLLLHDMINAGKRVQCLEAEINRYANAKLLVWETELGGLSHGYWKHRSMENNG